MRCSSSGQWAKSFIFQSWVNLFTFWWWKHRCWHHYNAVNTVRTWISGKKLRFGPTLPVENIQSHCSDIISVLRHLEPQAIFCLSKSLSMLTTKKISKLCIAVLFEGNQQSWLDIPVQKTVMPKTFQVMMHLFHGSNLQLQILCYLYVYIQLM